MNTKTKNTLKTLSAITLAVLVSVSITNAIGTLTPGDTPGDDTQYTLNDIYNKLNDFASPNAVSGSGTMTVPEDREATFATLSEIYALLEAEDSDLVPENIKDGITIFGVEGTLEPAVSLYEGYPLTWTADQGSMTLDQAKAQCASIDPAHRLPTISELVAAIRHQYDSGTESGPGGFVTDMYYWSGSYGPEGGYAWLAYWDGAALLYTSATTENELSVRCVR